jgi:hypothetical protein
MTPERWRDLLGTWSQEILAVEEYRQAFPPEVVRSAWLGYPGATEAEIADAEARLGMTLPPSYRTFLTVTNGWRMTTTFIKRVRPVGEVAWYRDVEPELLAIWLEAEQSPMEQRVQTDHTKTTGYGLQAALTVSDYGDGMYMLIPQRIAANGEWPAWFFAPWVPGERESASFWDLMVAQHRSFLNLERQQPH